jgi:hypothetical protein
MSYFSNLLTATKTRYQSLRAGDEADGDTENDSHISRVLRTYYAERGQAYPDWLGPPPNLRSQSPVTSLRNTYGRRQQNAAPPPGATAASLSDIWDAPAGSQQQQQQGGRPTFARGTSGSRPQRPQLFDGESNGTAGSSAGSSGSLTAQQRIKERLWGGRSNSSPPPQQQFAPPPPQDGKLAMPMGPSGGLRRGGSGAGMPWDNDAGGGYEPPAGGGYNARRGVRSGGGGLPNALRPGQNGSEYYR